MKTVQNISTLRRIIYTIVEVKKKLRVIIPEQKCLKIAISLQSNITKQN